MNSREERNRKFFEDEQTPVLNGSMDLWLAESSQNDVNSSFWQEGQQKQESILLNFDEAEDNIRQALEREQEVGHIVHSISELNHIFKVSKFAKFSISIKNKITFSNHEFLQII